MSEMMTNLIGRRVKVNCGLTDRDIYKCLDRKEKLSYDKKYIGMEGEIVVVSAHMDAIYFTLSINNELYSVHATNCRLLEVE